MSLLELFQYKLPVLSKPKDHDLTKQWVVDYGIWSKKKKCVVRKRVRVSGRTVEERLSQAKAIIDELTQVLSTGLASVDEEEPEPVTVTEKSKTESGVKPVKATKEPVTIAGTKISVAIKEYETLCEAKLAYNTYKVYRRSLETLMAYMKRHKRENLTLGAFDESDALKYLDELITVHKVSNRTRNNRKADVFTFFQHFIDRDKRKRSLIINPFSDISALPCIKQKHQSYSARQREAYRKTCEELGFDQLLLFCRFMYYVFLRPGEELRKLQVRDLLKDTIYVSAVNAKTNQGDYVDIPSGLEQLIVQHKLRDYPDDYYLFSIDGKPGPELLGPNYIYRRHVQVLKKMGLQGGRHDLYSWKHTGAIALWEATHDIELVRRQCRHSNIGMTIQYLRDLGQRVKNDKIHQMPDF